MHIESITEIKALISLLDEPNEENFSSIRDKIAVYGIDAIPFLRDAQRNTTDSEAEERIKDLVNDIYFHDTFKVLQNWSNDESKDLLAAYIAISRILHPDIDTEKYLNEFERISRDVWLELNDNLTALEKIKVLNHIIYSYYNFSGSRTPNGNNLNLYIFDQVLDKKKGNSLSLGILYLAIAQNLKIPLYGVDLPGHFVLCYLDENVNLKPASEYSQSEILFYLNAMNKGAVFTKNEISGFIKQMNLEPQSSHFLPCSNKTIIKRLLTEISREVKNNGDDYKSKLILNLVTAVV